MKRLINENIWYLKDYDRKINLNDEKNECDSIVH